jgi:tetratricopeptide (TPR) repeat protein
MWDLAVREEDYEAADSMLARLAQPPLSMQLFSAIARQQPAARETLLLAARAANSRQSQIAGRYLATFLEDLAGADSVARFDLVSTRRQPIRAGAGLFLSWLEVARGRWSQARRAFTEAEPIAEHPAVLVQRAVAATLPFLVVPRSDLDSVRKELERWRPDDPAPESGQGLEVRLYPELRRYLLGLVAVRSGDHAKALGLARELAQRSPNTAVPNLVRSMAHTIEADVAMQEGRAADALSVLERVAGEVPLELVSAPLYANVREFGQEHARFLRMTALRATGQLPASLQWARTAFQGSPREFVFLAPLHLFQAEVLEQMGSSAEAADHYRRFVALWGDPDPGLRQRVELARSRLVVLTTEQ